MKKKYFNFSYLFVLFFVACNNGNEIIEKIPEIVNKYDPGVPTTVDEILPIRGVIDQTFIINGNFPGELSDMKVYFASKKAILTATDGISITGLVPKQKDGLNQISVVLGTDSIVPAGMLFRYKQSRSIKTISGKLGVDRWMADPDYAGAALDAVTYGEVCYVAALAGIKQDIIFMEFAGWGDSQFFLLSQDDNTVQKLKVDDQYSCPAVNSTRDAFYVLNIWDRDMRTILCYSKANSWVPSPVGVSIPKSDLAPNWHVPSMTFAEDDNLLYAMDWEGRIAEVNLEEKSYKIYTSAAKKLGSMNPAVLGGLISGDLPTNFEGYLGSFITYSKYHHCFFASFMNQNAIYKLVKNADDTWTSTLYAGNNGGNTTMGDRLKDAAFNHPAGMVVNADGEIFVCNRDGRVIQKIVGNEVSLVAGRINQNNPLQNGDPLDATFDGPRNLSIDSDGNYIIAGGWDRTVRKLSIE